MKTVATAILLLLLGFGAAENWTVQTAAFQDYRQASEQVAELQSLGFDAYSEFAMQGGRQYARVRIGCFATRDAAVSFAGDIRGRITADAVAQPISALAAGRTCVRFDPGFVKPDRWELLRQGRDLLFRVELGGQVGFLQHDGGGWRFLHERPSPPAAGALTQQRFRQVRIGGLNLAQVQLADGSRLNACGGLLLWQYDWTVVVERASRVIACVVDGTTPGAR